MTPENQPPGQFRALGLQPRRDLTDDDVRAAWRRVAAATHPDRADGGDPAAFAAAAAAYTTLRTAGGRGEALADLRAPGDTVRPAPVPRYRHRAARLAALTGRVRRGRPLVLILRVLAAVAICATAVEAVGWQPASLATATGMLTWLLLTGRTDLAPPP